MLTFFILLLPASLAVYELEQKRSKDFLPIIIGFVSAVLICAFKVFFLFSHRIVPYSFGQNFTYIFIRQILLPLVFLYGAFFLLAKDNINDRLKYFFPLVVSFYAVYLPYTVLSAYDAKVYEGFDIFVKPMIFLSMIIECYICINAIYNGIISKSFLKAIFFSIIICLCIVLPAIIEAVYLMQMQSFIFVAGISILYILQSFLMLFFHITKCKK